MSLRARLVLASASPRRRDLLGGAGIDFEVDPAGVDESSSERDPRRLAEELASRKAREVSRRRPEDWVLGADTVVCVAGELLGKPSGAAEARRMLETLSDSVHEVVTGVCLVAPDGSAVTTSETTRVHMRPIAADEIEAYVASGEWRDKAGGYAIQENADAFVTELAGGGFDNVVGLPVDLVRRLLEESGFSPDAEGTDLASGPGDR